MIIEAKSTRQATTAAHESRKLFEFLTPDRLSRLPLYVAGIAVMAAVYLKSAMEGWAMSVAPQSTPDAAPQDLPQPVNWCLPGNELLNAALEYAQIDPTITGSTGNDAAGPRNQVGIGLPWPGRYVLFDSPIIQFARPFESVSPSIQPFFPAAFGFASSNDNPIAVRTDLSGPDVSLGDSVGRLPQSGGPSNEHGVEPDEDDEDDKAEPSNGPPMVTGPVRLNDVFAGQVVLIGLSQLLFEARDPDGDPLTTMNMSASGVAVVRNSTGWTVSTQPGMLGGVTLTYQISDGETAVWQTAYFDIIRKTQTLTPGDDLHVGTPYDDDIDAGNGDDIIDARAGNDLVVGGNGDDHINGSEGQDHLFGGVGNDVIFGGHGNDLIFGGNGDDRLFGDDGDDTINGDAGNDLLYGGTGNDLLSGGEGCDELDGGEGNDVLLGKAGNDLLDGGVGDDALFGGTGNDTLRGGAGADVLYGGEGRDALEGGDGDDRIVGDAGNDSIDGGLGEDVLDLSATSYDLIVDFVGGQSFSQEFGDDSFASIKHVIGGDGDDLFIVGATATLITGGRGRDTFIFTVIDENPALSEDVMHDILDFVVGDRIRVLEYEADRDAKKLDSDLFKSVYQDDDNDDWLRSDLPIVVRHDRINGIDHTKIMADIDRDDDYEITINIYGIHLPINFEPATA